MHYPRILALIDAELDRLQRARALLVSSLSSPGRAKKKPSPGSRPAMRETTKTAIPLPNEAPSQQEPVLPAQAFPRKPTRQVPRINEPAPRRSTPAPRTPMAAPFVSPLAGAVPSGPVFVSARQVHEQHSARQPTQAPEQGNPSATDNLNAELLRQKWLQNSAS
jgi:hypothetical protein